MPHKPRRPIAAALLTLMAAALACSPAAGATATPLLALTQAAATITAAANIMATSNAAPTAARLATQPPAATVASSATAAGSPTPGAGASLAPTQAVTATAETAASATPGASGQATALDPCTLITTADATTILGTPATDGVAISGYCTYQDARAKSQTVHVFAFQSRQSITGAILCDVSELLIGDTAATAQVNADVKSGDWVAAVNAMIASPAAMPDRTMVKVDGVGDAAMFAHLALGGRRLDFALVAKKDVVIGFTLALVAGDAAATQKAVVPLLQSILARLPPSFTVNGAP